MQHLHILGQLAQSQAKLQARIPTDPAGNLDLEFLKNNETLRFNHL